MTDLSVRCTKAIYIINSHPGLLYHTLWLYYTFNNKRASSGQWVELYDSWWLGEYARPPSMLKWSNFFFSYSNNEDEGLTCM